MVYHVMLLALGLPSQSVRAHSRALVRTQVRLQGTLKPVMHIEQYSGYSRHHCVCTDCISIHGYMYMCTGQAPQDCCSLRTR